MMRRVHFVNSVMRLLNTTILTEVQADGGWERRGLGAQGEFYWYVTEGSYSTQRYTTFRTYLDPKNMLIGSRYVKT